jgi:hypothetical protein
MVNLNETVEYNVFMINNLSSKRKEFGGTEIKAVRIMLRGTRKSQSAFAVPHTRLKIAFECFTLKKNNQSTNKRLHNVKKFEGGGIYKLSKLKIQ